MRNKRAPGAATRRLNLAIDPRVVVDVDVHAARSQMSRNQAVEQLLAAGLQTMETPS